MNGEVPYLFEHLNDYQHKHIKVRYVRDITPIKQEHNSDWIDLRCAEDIILEKGQFMYIPLGVVIELPEGYEAYIIPRSSTFKKHGIIQTNSMGLIDESYKGDNDEWCMPVYAVRTTHIEKDTRICQFRINRKMFNVFIDTCTEPFGNTDRGGLGSTGEK